MTKLLLKAFVKDYQNVKDPAVRESYGKFAGAVGIVSNLILCLMKVLIGFVANSIAIVADGINNLADASSSVITLIGFKLASKPENEKHPYGHARIEYLTGLVISVLIIIVGFELLKTSVGKVLHPDQMEFSWVTIIVLAVAIGIKCWQALFNMSLGRKIDSLALTATGADSRNDVISTSAVLVSVIIGKFSGLTLDGYMGCIVALFIMWSGISLVKETVSPLLGEAPDEDLVREIRELVEGYEGVLGIHDLIVHNYGPGKIFCSIHIEVDAHSDILESHDMIDRIEAEVGSALHIHITGHMDPIVTDDPVLNKLKEVTETKAGEIEGIYGIHDFRMVPGETHTNVIFDALKSFDCKYTDEQLKGLFSEELQKLGKNYLVVINFDKAYTKPM